MDIPRLQKTLEAAGFTVQWFPTAQAAKEALVRQNGSALLIGSESARLYLP